MCEVIWQCFHLGIMLLLRREEGVPCDAVATRARQRMVAGYIWLVLQYEMKQHSTFSAVY